MKRVVVGCGAVVGAALLCGHLDPGGVGDAIRRVLEIHPNVIASVDALVAFLDTVAEET
jgi:hypothetical protein